MFVYPALLWGLLLLGVPLLIHLIHWLRYRRVEWGAMEFLLAAYRKHRSRVRMKEFLLLLMRMAAVALIVLMVAQPILQDRLGSLVGGLKVHHVVILDDSFSMSDRWGERSVWENARERLTHLASELEHQTATQNFTLLRTSQSDREHPKPDFHAQRIDTSFSTTLSQVLENLSPSSRATPLSEALERAEELVPQQPGEKRIVYLVSDFRRKDWDENPPLKKKLEEWSESETEVHLLDTVSAEHPNLTISHLVAESGTRAAGVPVRMKFRVTNYGTATVQNVVVHPEIQSETGSEMLPAVTLAEIPAGKSVEGSFAVRFPIAGSYGVTASLDVDAVLRDNQAFCALEIPPFESVLVIDDRTDAEASRPFLTALAPGGNVATGIVTRLETSRFLATHSLDAFQTIYLLNVRDWEPLAVTALETFLQKGGGVAFFVGDETDPILLQKAYRQGEGFFPVLLKQPTELPADYLQKLPDLRVSHHPLFRVFQESGETLLSTVHIHRYYTLEDESLEKIIPIDSGGKNDENMAENVPAVRTIAALRNNAPLILESTYGKGRFLLFLTTADASWNNWPQGNPSYVVVLLQLQAYLSGLHQNTTFWNVGERISLQLSAETYFSEVIFHTPKKELWETLPGTATTEETFSVQTSPAQEPGFFTVTLKNRQNTEEKRFLPVNVDFREGEMAKISPEELAQSLPEGTYSYHPAGEFHHLETDHHGFPLANYLLYLLLLWLFAEMLLAQNASYHTR
ncbi:MAG: BatA domain-containing protein [Planctomycetia bacterium]|nr:BatA domain-containing protein [Planctomycetia bacterium]